LTPDLLNKIYDYKVLGIGDEQWQIIKKLYDVMNVDDLKQVKGFGPWSIDAIKLQTGTTEPNILLAQDLWIRKRVSEIFVLNKTPTEKETRKIFEGYQGHLTLLSRFLWRLTPLGAQKVKEFIQTDSLE
jgi:3-methyladenine DNA glycosylase/8-oxoguanine DNA glycosylase